MENPNLYNERSTLPIWSVRKPLLKLLNISETSIIIGETGSGKTTQITQLLLENKLNRNGIITCTQPRRIAAITVAQRVSKEAGCELGTLVGYNVRFDDTSSKETRILYMTDGMLLREALLDPLLKRYTVIILDEAHERTIQTDVLFGVVKEAQKIRKNRGMHWLKIIVMSATMDVDQFSNYFNKAPIFYIEGRQHPINILHTKDVQSDYIEASLIAIFQIHKETPASEDILVFVTGQEEIDSMVHVVKQIAKDVSQDLPSLVVMPMYSSLPPSLQLKIFSTLPKGYRKVIISTNIAETSVTIPNIKHVIDTGKVKMRSYNPDNGLDLLKVQNVSKAQAWQRTGRAGREAPGTCYRLYTEAEFSLFTVTTIPEILRSNIGFVILQLLFMGIKNIGTFDFIDKPNPISIKKGKEELYWLGAIDDLQEPKLTELGYKMAAFPLEPHLSKVLLSTQNYHCLEEILSIIAMLSGDSIFVNPSNKREEINLKRKKFLSMEGDHMTMLNVYRAFKAFKANKEWCKENFINSKNLKHVIEIRKQLKSLCQNLGLKIESSGKNSANIRKCLCTGFFMNVAELQKDGNYLTIYGKKQTCIHPSSSLFQYKPSCVLYNELVQTSKVYMRDVCPVEQDWLRELAPIDFKMNCFKEVYNQK